MSDYAIKIEGLGKQYVIGGAEEPYRTFRESMTNALAAPFRRLKRLGGAVAEEERIWALRGIDLDIRHGEIIGIIGRNGAGKSTLLKILSRITEPTEGRVVTHGRVASLLEVGTGFHPELTGRENIYLNGAILGMSRKEIECKFDEIVAFAEVEKFLDTPVKRYSSGMYVRLAFAVAAHLEPEILLVDEVLAVGDAAFQKKCLGKMGNVSREGRTILFVSHNMAAVKALCGRGVVLHQGHKIFDGDTADAIDFYLKSTFVEAGTISWKDRENAPGNESISLNGISINPLRGAVLDIDSGVVIKVGFDNLVVGANIDCTLTLLTMDGIHVFQSGIMVSTNNDSKEGCYSVRCEIPPQLLNSGNYRINLIFGRDQYYALFAMEDVTSFEIQNTATGRGSNMRRSPGVIRPRLEWSTKFESSVSQIS